MVGEGGQRIRWAESACDQADRAANSLLTHLHEVLLAGQSKPVPDRGQQVPAGQRAEVHSPAGARIGQLQPVECNGLVDLTWHGR